MIGEDKSNKSIGKRIREAREAVGLSQKQLAEKIGHETATAIYLIEMGERKVSAVDLDKVARTLDRDIKYFLDEEDTIPNIRVALRADPDISDSDKKAILHFIDLAKGKNERGK